MMHIFIIEKPVPLYRLTSATSGVRMM
ncbi:unnamed protein product, partial [Adineta steineri]